MDLQFQAYRDGLKACIERHADDADFVALFNRFTGYHFTPDCLQDSLERSEFNLAVHIYRWLPELERRR